MNEVKILFSDVETTGLPKRDGDLNNHRIIELAIAVYGTSDNGKTHRKIGKTMVKRFNPLRRIDKGAEQVHGISLVELRNEAEFGASASKLMQLLDMANIIVFHNADFDVPFIIDELHRAGEDITPLEDKEIFCTMEHGRSVTAMGKLPSLKELCWASGIEYDTSKAHAADYDTDILAESFWIGVNNGTFQPKTFKGEVISE